MRRALRDLPGYVTSLPTYRRLHTGECPEGATFVPFRTAAFAETQAARHSQVVCVKFSKKILGMWAQVKPRARSGALGESSAERPQRVRQLAAS